MVRAVLVFCYISPSSVHSAQIGKFRNREISLVSHDSTLYFRKAKIGLDIDFGSKKGLLRIYQESNQSFINQKFQIGKKVYLIQSVRDLSLHSNQQMIRLSVYTPQKRFSNETLFQKLCKMQNPPATSNLIKLSEAMRTSNFAKVFDQKTCSAHDTTAYGKIFSDSANSIIETAENCSEGFLKKSDPSIPEWALRFVGFYKSAIQSVIDKIDTGKGGFKVICPNGESNSMSKKSSSLNVSVSSNSVAQPSYEIQLETHDLQPEDDEMAISQSTTALFTIIQHELKHVGLPFEPTENQNKCEHKLFNALENMCKGRNPKVFLDSVMNDCRSLTGGGSVNTVILPVIAQNQEKPRTLTPTVVAASTPGPRTGSDKEFTAVVAQESSASGAAPVRATTVADGGASSQPSSQAPSQQTGYARPVEPNEYPAIDRSVRENLPAAVRDVSAVHESIFGGPASSSAGDSDAAVSPSRSRNDETTSVQGMAAQLLATSSPLGGAPTTAQTNWSNRISKRLDAVGDELNAVALALVPAAQAAELKPNEIVSYEATVQPNGQITLASGGPIADLAAREWAGLGGAFEQGASSGISTMASASAGQGKSVAAKTNTAPAARMVSGITNTASSSRKLIRSGKTQGASRTVANATTVDSGSGVSTEDSQLEDAGIDPEASAIPNSSSTKAKAAVIKLSPEQKLQIASLSSIRELSGPRYIQIKSQYSNPAFQTALRNQGICIQFKTAAGVELIGAREKCKDQFTNDRKPASSNGQDAQQLMRNLQNRRRENSSVIMLIDNGSGLERDK